MKDESYIGQDRREEKVFAYKSVQAHRIFLAALSIQRYDNLLIYRPELTSDHTINSVFSVRILPGPPVNVVLVASSSIFTVTYPGVPPHSCRFSKLWIFSKKSLSFAEIHTKTVLSN